MRPVLAPHEDAALGLVHADVGVFENAHHRLDMVEPRAFEANLAARRGNRHDIGPGLDPVRDHDVAGAMQARHAAHGEPVGADPLDARAHGVEAGGEIDDLGLTGGIDQYALSPSASVAAIQDMLGGADRDAGKGDFGTLESRSGHARASI